MVVAFYERVSSNRQEKEETVETQHFFLEEYTKEKGHEVYDTYRDLNVGNEVPLPDRPGFQRLYADAQAGRFDTVLCYSFKRWSRDEYVYQEGRKLLLRLGIDLLCLDIQLKFDTAEDQFMSKVVLGSQQYAQRKANEDMKNGRQRHASTFFPDEGSSGYPGGPVDFGYQLKAIKPKGSVFTICDTEAIVVRRIYSDLVLERLSARQIAIALNREGVPIPSDCQDGGYRGRGHRGRGQPVGPALGKWRAQMIAKLVHKTVYKGFKHYGKTRLTLPPIIPDELWEQAQSALTLNKKCSSRNAKHEYLLAGKIHCVDCDRRLIGRMGILRKDGSQEVRYYCQGQQEQMAQLRETDCPVHSFYATSVEVWIWGRLMEHITNHEATVLRLLASSGTEEEHRTKLTKERERLHLTKQAEIKTRNAAMTGKSPLGFDLEREDAEQLYRSTLVRLQQIDQEIDRLNVLITSALDRERALADITAHLAYWHQQINRPLSPRAKRHVVAQFVERIDVQGDAKGLWFTVHFRFDPVSAPVSVPREVGCKGGEVLSIDNLTTRSKSINCSILEEWRMERKAA